MKIPECFVDCLCVPGQPAKRLRLVGQSMVSDDGAFTFPVINGTPILINEGNSVFRIDDFQPDTFTTMDLRDKAVRLNTTKKRIKARLGRLIPRRTRFVSDFPAAAALSEILHSNPEARILVVGAGENRFKAHGNVVYSDVAMAGDTHLIADAHDIPFVDGTFDAILAVAVLEHVADPNHCVDEFRRVLRPEGLVYAVTPFMQQVHMGRYDFTRFTAMGHRRLFRWFDERRSGVSNGPGMVIAWSLEYWLSSFSSRESTRRLLRTLSRFLGWPFLLLDHTLAMKPGSYDCASAFYFYGSLRESPIADREIVTQYRGLNNVHGH